MFIFGSLSLELYIQTNNHWQTQTRAMILKGESFPPLLFPSWWDFTITSSNRANSRLAGTFLVCGENNIHRLIQLPTPPVTHFWKKKCKGTGDDLHLVLPPATDSVIWKFNISSKDDWTNDRESLSGFYYFGLHRTKRKKKEKLLSRPNDSMTRFWWA